MDSRSARARPRSEIPDWKPIAACTEFKQLLATKKRFVIPTYLFFSLYYLSLPILIGYAPKFMSTRVIGTVTLAYLFTVSQFLVILTIACLYLKTSAKLDQLTRTTLERGTPPTHFGDAASLAIQNGSVGCPANNGGAPAPNSLFGTPRTMFNPRQLQLSAKFSF